MQFTQLRKQYPLFVFKSFSWHFSENDLVVEFQFQVGEYQFVPHLTFHSVPDTTSQWLATSEANNYLLHLGMIEAISYWKATCSPQFIIQAGQLSTGQLAWWHELYLNGLAEFFYRNEIDPSQPGLLRFECQSDSTSDSDQDIHLSTITNQETVLDGDVLSAAAANTIIASSELEQPPILPRTRFLVGVGGGKDSAVTLGFLDQLNRTQSDRFAYGAILLAPLSPAAEAVAAQSNATQIHRITRVIDPHLLELNALGYLNGHTPFSAYFAFVSILAARIYGYEQVVVSNENSANEGNLIWHDLTINHQYSKTFAFETTFREYLNEWFGQYPVQPGYFSILRPLGEVQIAKQFSHYPGFWPVFRSCNVGQKTNTWCQKCPKCAFVFTLLSCFLEETILVGQIFDHNLYEDADLIPIFHQLIGFEANKPFECVGTKAEVLSALAHRIKQLEEKDLTLPVVLKDIKEKVAVALETAKPLSELLNAWDSEHHLPQDLEFALKDLLTPSPST